MQPIDFPELGAGHEWYWGGSEGCWLNTADGRALGTDGTVYASLMAYHLRDGAPADGPDFVVAPMGWDHV